MKLSLKEKIAYGLGAVGKDMVYMLSSGYVLYYYQDLLGVNAIIMGMILMIARVFDAFNDPIMGVLVAKTKTKWGKFRPWLLIGTILNAILLYLLFAAPPALDGGGLIAYAAICYIIWGVTYTMMDIPFWSMIPAFTESGKERENLSTLARSCAGVGSAIVTICTMMAVQLLGSGDEVLGFKYFALIISILFIAFTVFACISIKEKSTVDMETSKVTDMFKALIHNDQALTVVVSIVLINCSLYITSNLLIYFFKYDIGGDAWYANYTMFTAFGGGMQILAMMLFFPLLRKKLSAIAVFYMSFIMSMCGYAILLLMTIVGIVNLYLLLIPAFLVFASVGMLTVLTTVFLANTVEYGEWKNGRRDESVIFSMQTFVVKLASGIAAMIASLTLTIGHISSDSSEDTVAVLAENANLNVLRGAMTILPIIGMLVAFLYFRKKFILTDQKVEEISQELKAGKHQA